MRESSILHSSGALPRPQTSSSISPFMTLKVAPGSFGSQMIVIISYGGPYTTTQVMEKLLASFHSSMADGNCSFSNSMAWTLRVERGAGKRMAVTRDRQKG